MKRKSLELSVIAFSLAVALLIAEFGVRFLLPQVGWGSTVDPTLGWSSWEYQGLSAREPALDVETRRLLFLGDSFLAGGGVKSPSERYPEILEKRLGSGYTTRILASGGWGTDQELLAFLQKGRGWDPDLVVLSFCATNDLANVLSNGRGGRSRKPYFQLGAEGRLVLCASDGTSAEVSVEPFLPRSRMRSYLANLVRHWLRPKDASKPKGGLAAVEKGSEAVDERYLMFPAYQSLPEQKRKALGEIVRLESQLSWVPQGGVNHVSAFIHEDFELNRYQWELVEALLAKLQHEVRAIDARLVVCLLPVPFQAQDYRFVTGSSFEHRFETPRGPFTFRAAEPRDRLREICARQEIDLFDPTEAFVKVLREEDRLLEAWPDPEDIHFSGTGHRILAELLHEYLERTGFPLAR